MGLYSVLFLVCFLPFLAALFLSGGVAADPSGVMYYEPYKYWHNLVQMPVVAVVMAAGVLAVLTGMITGYFRSSRKAIWWSGIGTVLTVLSLLLLAGWNGTAYYPSNADLQSSLTIYNSSSSEFTLQVMSIVSLLIPFVVAYIWYAWRSINRKRITRMEIENDGEHQY